jgi:1-phosphofructokinase family hexose kinase
MVHNIHWLTADHLQVLRAATERNEAHPGGDVDRAVARWGPAILLDPGPRAVENPGMIYTLTANPALDRELRVPAIAFGDVLRASQSRVDPGGKGFNVSRALRGLGAESVAVGLVGGFAGQQLAACLAEAGVAVDLVPIEGETRTNVTVVDAARHLKVNEAGPTVSAAEQRRLLEKVRALVRAGDFWVLSGSLPPGAAPELYAEIVRIVNEAGARALLDASGPPLARGCGAAPFLVKPNAAEAAELTGLPVEDETGARAAAARFHAMGVAQVVVSMGERGAVLSSGAGARAWVARPPAVVERNPIGAGDSMVAGLVWALSRGLAVEEALRWGVASGAAAASLDGTAFGTRAQVEGLERQVELAALPG